MSTNISIPRIKDTDTAEASTFNKPIAAIESNLNSLNSAVGAATSKSAVIAYEVPMSTECFIGALVYFDSNSHTFRPAIAAEAIMGGIKDGKYVNAPQAAVLGMVIKKPESYIGDILLSGYFKSLECVNNCLKLDISGTATTSTSNPSPGNYYLSNVEHGKASLSHNGIVVQPVLTYIGDDEFILNITHQMPSQYQGSMLRGIISKSDNIKVTADNESGVVSISSEPYTQSDTVLSPIAISGIYGSKFTVTPVATTISGVGRITVTRNDLGEHFISTIEDIGGRIEAHEYNLNGAKRSSDNIFTYIVMPSGKSSSFVFSTHVNTEADTHILPWLDVVNTPACTLTATVYFIPDDIPDDGISTSAVKGTTMSVEIQSSSSNLLTYKAESSVIVKTSGTIWVNVSADSPSSDVYILRAGVLLEPSASVFDTSSIFDKGALVSTARVDASVTDGISKDTVVGLNEEGKIVRASSDDIDIPVFGVSLSSAGPGELCKVTTEGLHRTDNDLVFGSPYFVGHNGEITTIFDQKGYSCRIGESVGVNTLRVDIEERIL